MTYQKPEILDLGRAIELVRGEKAKMAETHFPFLNQLPSGAELDD